MPEPLEPPLVIAHRGAPGYRPEHTLASYRLAIALGADYVEPDLVSTRDGVLVARHEHEIGATTDVAGRREFADRLTTKVVDGQEVTGWFSEDFTLAELKTLRAVERLPDAAAAQHPVRRALRRADVRRGADPGRRGVRRLGRRIGVYPETKHPSYFASIGLALEEPLLAALARHGLDRPGDPVFIQSFEPGNLQWLRSRTAAAAGAAGRRRPAGSTW